jgi:hypothetical protein
MVALLFLLLDFTVNVPPRLFQVLDGICAWLQTGPPQILDGVPDTESIMLDYVDALDSAGMLIVMRWVVDSLRLWPLGQNHLTCPSCGAAGPNL